MSARIKLAQAIVASSIAIACAGSTFAANSAKPECPTPTKEMREKLAARHEQMAACLRSDKPIAECRTEMTKMHEEMMGEMGCPGGKMHPHGDKQPRPSPQT